MSLATIVIVGLAAYRATRLVTTDTLTDPFRESITNWAWASTGQNPTLRAGAWRSYVAELVSCPFCVGVWAAIGAYAWYEWWVQWPIYIAAIAGAAAILAALDIKLVGD